MSSAAEEADESAERSEEGASKIAEVEKGGIGSTSLLTVIKQEQEDTDNETEIGSSNVRRKDDHKDGNTDRKIMAHREDDQPIAKRAKVEFVDAESNTLQTGEYHRQIGPLNGI